MILTKVIEEIKSIRDNYFDGMDDFIDSGIYPILKKHRDLCVIELKKKLTDDDFVKKIGDNYTYAKIKNGIEKHIDEVL